ncbi:MAG TPA: DUF86 domain-containing protein [Methanocorpusculum sp.]|nr:DUF86 domain-containing protein [Methanocorpusculum sp.]
MAASVSEDEFYSNEDVQDIIIRSLKVIGEASTHLSEEFKEVHSDIPLRKIKDFRNIIVHQYFRVDMRAVFGTVIDDIPVLRMQIEDIIHELS